MKTIQIVGNLTGMPEQKAFGDKNLVNFCLAVNGRKDEDAEFYNCTAWGKTAEIIGGFGLEKGTKLAVSGEPKLEKSNDGKIFFKIVVDKFEICSKKSPF